MFFNRCLLTETQHSGSCINPSIYSLTDRPIRCIRLVAVAATEVTSSGLELWQGASGYSNSGPSVVHLAAPGSDIVTPSWSAADAERYVLRE